MKKLFAILLAVVMILAMSVTAFAEEPEKVTLTLTGVAGHKYAIYQIFTGTVSEATEGTPPKKVLSNVKYGQSYGTKDEKVSDSALKTLLETENLAEYLGEVVTNPIKETTLADITEDNTIVIPNLDPGYYLIKDITGADLPDGHTLSPVMLQILETLEISSKHASITSEKKVDDHNDSNHDEDGRVWQDVADYDVGDFVPFKMSVTLPTTFNSYTDDYVLTFHDKQDASFGLPSQDPAKFKVYLERVDGNGNVVGTYPIPANYGYTFEAECANQEGKCEFGGCSFSITCNVTEIYTNLVAENEDITGFQVNDKIVVEYESQLLRNGSTSYGRGGNINRMYVCHPDGHTPIDYVSVLTYQLTVNKVDKDNVALPGAGFTLYKWIADNSEAGGSWNPVGAEVGGEDYTGNVFAWTGFDGGKYKLVETTTPDTYNTMADLEFVVNAEHETVWHGDEGTLRLHFITAMAPDNSKAEFKDRDENGVEDGNLAGNIVNYKGVQLPSTGAEGTLFLITGGTLLVLVAAVFMITRKKMSVYED